MPPSKKNELVDAATKVFLRHGFHSTNLDAVLEEGGISRMTLYNHFKSKDELILAALQHRDEIFTSQLLEYIEAHADDPIGRILAVFDFHRQWFAHKDFRGCMFINATAEFGDPDCPVRKLACETKRSIVRFLRDQCEQAKLSQPSTLAEKLSILLEGAIVTAQVVGQVGGNETSTDDAALWAKQIAQQLIAEAQDN